jgi:predicted  nucleic acid-binding Zn-ribbon protein
LKKQEDELEKLEKELKSKQQTAEYIRSILMALASSPLTPQEKIQAKKNELEDLKLEIQKIEIKIQKIRMQKKTA